MSRHYAFLCVSCMYMICVTINTFWIWIEFDLRYCHFPGGTRRNKNVLWRQNDAVTSFRRHNDVIIEPRARWVDNVGASETAWACAMVLDILHPSLQISRYQKRWWRHQMEKFSAFLALCERNPPVTGGFPSQRPVTQSFGVFFDLRLNKRLSKQSKRRLFGTPSCSLLHHCNEY